jgi:deoxyhypusine synthase
MLLRGVFAVQIIARLGQAINHPDSVYYWAWKNNIPVFCPAITDGSIGKA